jgi:hypothetical protein
VRLDAQWVGPPAQPGEVVSVELDIDDMLVGATRSRWPVASRRCVKVPDFSGLSNTTRSTF